MSRFAGLDHVPKLRDERPMAPGEIRAIREVCRATQAEMAEWLGIAANTWARWERGEREPEPLMRHYLRWLRSENE